jgi:hypothetical protein
MASVDSLAANNKLVQDSSTNIQNDVQNYQRQAAAKQAADLYKQGDVRGAYSALMAHDPEFAQKIAPDLVKIDPELAAQFKGATTTADENAMNAAGNGKAQVAQVGAEARIAAAEARAKNAEDALHYQKNGYTGDTNVFTKGGALKGSIGPDGQIVPPKTTPATQSNANSPVPSPTAPNLNINQEVDSNGQLINLNPKQLADISKNTAVFNKESKPITDAINATAGSEKLLDSNIPGAQIAEKIKTIRGLYQGGRIPQQIIQQYGNGSAAGFETQLQDWAAQAQGKGLGSQARQNMYNLNQAIQTDAIDQYEALLKQRSQQVGDANHLDPYVVKMRFASQGPTQIQQVAEAVKKLPPQDQAAFHWAHENALDPRAKAIIKVLGF